EDGLDGVVSEAAVLAGCLLAHVSSCRRCWGGDDALTSHLWRGASLPDLRIYAVAREVVRAEVCRRDSRGQVLLHARLLAPQKSRHDRGVEGFCGAIRLSCC